MSRLGRCSLVLVLAVALLAGACSGGGGPTPTPATPSSGRTGTSVPPTRPRLPLGSVRLDPGTVTKDCVVGFRCQPFEVTCPDVRQPERGVLQVERPAGTPKGLVMYFSGDTGQHPWVDTHMGDWSLTFVHAMAGLGYEQVMVVWAEPWLVSAPRESVGPARLACRAASVVRFVHDTMYAQLGVHPAPRECGFCLTGNSGGSSEVAYALSRYGLDRLVQVAVLTGGVPHASIQKGCVGKSNSPYLYGPETRFFDVSYGFSLTESGPCTKGTRAFEQRWIADSVNSPGADLHYPDTRVVVLEGAEDTSTGIPHATDYVDALRAAGSPYVEVTRVPGVSHGIAGSAAGVAAVRDALLRV